MNKHTILPLFSVPLFITDLSVECERVLEKIVNIEYKSCEDSFGYNKGKISKNEKLLEDLDFLFLKQKIDEAFDIYLHEVLMYERSDKFKFLHETSWATKHSYGDFSVLHCHKNSMYSFVFYVDVDGTEECGDIIFSSPISKSTYSNSAFDIPISSYNIFNSMKWSIIPKNKMLIIFPSHLDHSVNVNKTQKDRYCIAGNYFCRGSIDLSTSSIKL